MKTAVLGTGFGAYHAGLYKKVNEVESVILFGRNKEKLRELGDKLQIETTDDLQRVYNDPDIGLIDVCLPTEHHCEAIVEALKHGKHVFCETPLCQNPEETELIRKAARKYGRRVFVDLFIKFAPEYQYLYETVRDSSLGGLKAFTITRKTAPVWGDLGLHKIATSLMIHDLDMAVWLMGSPNEILASGIQCNLGESHVQASLLYENCIMTAEASSMMPKSYPFTVGYEAVFEKGTIEYREQCAETGSVKSVTEYTAEGTKQLHFDEPDPYELALRHVIECCLENKETILGADAAADSLKIAFKLRDMFTAKDQ